MKRLLDCLNDTADNYILPFFWQHGEDDQTLLREIDAIHQSGIRALCVESRPHEQFCQDNWWHTMDVIIDACRQRNMKVWMFDDKRFPSGYANGIIGSKYPERRMWGVTEHHVDVVGPVVEGAVMCPGKMVPEDKILGVYACRRLPNGEKLNGEVLDLSANICDDMVYFTVPEGGWRIVFLIQTRRGLNQQFYNYADKLTAEGGDAFLEAVYEPHYAHYHKEFGKTFMGFFADEPCFGNNMVNLAIPFRAKLGRKYSHFPYTDEMLRIMQEKLGEPPLPLMPLLWFDSDDPRAARVRLAYMDTITELYRKNFSCKIGDWCRSHGVSYIGHTIEDNEQHTKTQYGCGHYFRALDGQDMSGIDAVLCHIVPGMTDYGNRGFVSFDFCNPEFYHFTLPKLSASHAHIQPLKKGRALCEIYGAYGWAEGLKMMKWLTDFMLVRGQNHFVPHAFNPRYPDPECPPYFFAGGHNPQFKDFRYLMEYMNRVCHLTNGGTHVPSAAILYHAEAEWACGDTEIMPINTPARILTEANLDFDIIPHDYLLSASVKDHKIELNHETYPALIVPFTPALPLSVLQTLTRFSQEGLPVLVVGEMPTVAETGEKYPYLADAGAISLSAHELPCTLRERGFGDVTPTDEARFLRHYHIYHGHTHTYLLTNEDINHTIQTEVEFSAFSGGEYVVYDALTNRAVRHRAEQGKIRVSLAPYESLVYMFGDIPCQIPPAENVTWNEEIPLHLTWQIAISEEKDYPAYTPLTTTDQLYNINGPKGDPRFCGYIRYESTIQISTDGQRVCLDLGAVGETAHLAVNGTPVGVRLAPPYRFDITDQLTDKENLITVEVVTHRGYADRDNFSSFLMFEPTGLLGPVRLLLGRVEN